MGSEINVSHSQLDAFRCALRWYLQQVRHVAEAPSPHLIFGVALHAVIEAHGKGEVNGVLDLFDLGLTTLDREWRAADPHGQLAEDIPALRQRLVTALLAFEEEVAPEHHPTHVELSFRFSLDEAYRALTAELGEATAHHFILGGMQDLMAASHLPLYRDLGQHILQSVLLDPQSPQGVRVWMRGRCDTLEPDLIRDLKTSGKSWPVARAHDSEQATAYLLASRLGAFAQQDAPEVRIDVPPVERVVFTVFAQTKPQTCRIQHLATTRTPRQFAVYIGKVAHQAKEMAALRQVPVVLTEKLATVSPLCRFCGVLGSCAPGQEHVRKDGRGPAVPMVTEGGRPCGLT